MSLDDSSQWEGVSGVDPVNVKFIKVVRRHESWHLTRLKHVMGTFQERRKRVPLTLLGDCNVLYRGTIPRAL